MSNAVIAQKYDQTRRIEKVSGWHTLWHLLNRVPVNGCKQCDRAAMRSERSTSRIALQKKAQRER